MPTLSITKNYADGTALTKTQLDSAFDSVSTFVNTTKLDADNLQDAIITAAKLASTSVTAAKIDTDAVTTAKIQDASVTKAKLAALGQSVSSSSSTFSTTSLTYVDVTNLTVTFTRKDRPVMLMMIPDGSNPAYVLSAAATNITDSTVKCLNSTTSTNLGEYPAGVAGCHYIWIDTSSSTASTTYKIQAKMESGATYMRVYSWKLLAFEL